MKRRTLCCALAACCSLMIESAQAQLFDRGGGLLYDDVLNVTWLADANYAKTSGFDADGKMSWQNATAWVSNLSYFDSVRNTTYSDWRLPDFTDLGGAGCDYGYSGTDCGFNVSTSSSELAHLFYGDFANKGALDSRGLNQSGYGLVDDPNDPDDESLFNNLQSYGYWMGRSYTIPGASTPDTAAWYLQFSTGMQNTISKGTQYYVLAVRDGDVTAMRPVPLPATAWLFGSAMLGFGFRKSGRHQQLGKVNFVIR